MKTFKSLRLPALGAEGQSRSARVALNIFKILGLLALLIIALVFPQQISPDEATTTIAFYTLMFAAFVTAWNIFSGYSGYISLGHAAFFGVGGYVLAIIDQDWHIRSKDFSFLFLHFEADYKPFLFLPIVGLVAGLLAVPLGWIALHTRRHTFIVITIAIFFIFQLLAENNVGKLTNGAAGLEYVPLPQWRYPFYNYPFYYAMLAILVLALAVSWWVRHSKYGLGLLAIRDDEDRALGLGVKTGASKLVAFVISAFFVGMVGGVWGYFTNSVFPQSAFNPLNDIAVALMAFLGGLGTLAGPIIGALILEPTQQYFTVNYGASGYYLIIYGALFLVIMLLLPEGILPTLRKWWSRWLALRAGPETPPLVARASNQAEPLAAKQPETGEEVNR
jgi:branched-chain amino acid transport system permease protein